LRKHCNEIRKRQDKGIQKDKERRGETRYRVETPGYEEEEERKGCMNG